MEGRRTPVQMCLLISTRRESCVVDVQQIDENVCPRRAPACGHPCCWWNTNHGTDIARHAERPASSGARTDFARELLYAA